MNTLTGSDKQDAIKMYSEYLETVPSKLLQAKFAGADPYWKITAGELRILEPEGYVAGLTTDEIWACQGREWKGRPVE